MASIFLKAKSLQTTLVTLAITCLNLFTGIQIARSLGPYSRGELSLLTAWTPMLATIFAGGVIDVLSHHIGQNQKSEKVLKYLSTAQLVLFITSLGGIAFGYLTNFIVIDQRLPEYKIFAGLFLLFIPLTNISNINMALDLARGKVERYNLSRTFPAVIYFVGTLCSLHFLADPIPGIMGVTLIQAAFPTLLNLKSLWDAWAFAPTRESLNWIWTNSIPLWPGVALTVIATQADRLIGTLLLMFNDLGIFHVAQSLSLTAVSVLSFTPYLLILPAASQIADSAARKQFVVNQISLWNLILFGFAIVFVPIGYFGAPLILGPDFHSTGLAMAILAPGHAALMSRTMASRALRSVGYSSVSPISESIFLFLLVCSAVLINVGGGLSWFSLAVASSVCSCIATLIFFLILTTRMRISLSSIISIRKNITRIQEIVFVLLGRSNNV